MNKVRTWLILAVAVATPPVTLALLLAADGYRDAWRLDGNSDAVLIAQMFSVTAAAAGGAYMVVRRPSNRCGLISIAMGVAIGAWYVAVFGGEGGLRQLVADVLVYSLRPLLFLLVLAFPIGRLDRVSRRLFAVLLVGPVLAFVTSVGVDTGDYPSVTHWWHEARWTLLTFSAWWDVGAFLAAGAVLVVVRRRTLRFRGSGSALAAPALWAAIVATGADFVLITGGPIRDLMNHNDHLTAYGMVVQVIDIGRWGVVALILAFGARRGWPRERAGARTVQLGSAPLDESLRAHVARLLDDPTADVAMRDPVLGWVDLAGRARSAPRAGTGATVLTQDGVPLAALEYDETVAAHPAMVDAAVTAIALELESVRQVTLAQAREEDLRRLARDVVEAEDAARRRLEHDLHDGAQQVLVGTTLQATLAAAAGNGNGARSSDVDELTGAIEEARRVLLAAATGRPPALLAERGLHGALGALAVTASVPVRVDIDPCDDLSEPLQRAIWFTASEAVTNALKHAAPSTLSLQLRRGTEITLTVADDGGGGAPDAPEALARRVVGAGGALYVDSTSSGTTVVAAFPLAAEVLA